MIGGRNYINYPGAQQHQQTIDEHLAERTQEDLLLNVAGTSLQATARSGEIRLTILGEYKKDYHFYPDALLTQDAIARITEFITDKRVDNIKLPLLSNEGARELQRRLTEQLPNFSLHINLGSVCPIIKTDAFTKDSYQRAITEYEKRAAEFRELDSRPPHTKKLHCKRWGDNRSAAFFDYLDFLHASGHAKAFGLYINDALVSYVQLILTGDTAHYYYSIYDQDYDGAGTAILNYAMRWALNSDEIQKYSFGRGAERFKHRWSTHTIKNYELRGFLTGR